MMKIVRGLMSGQVLQRDKRGFGHARINGVCSATGTVEIRGAKSWQTAGRAANGSFQARLTGLNTGGPYRVELRIGREKLTIHDVFVGDVWILAGQSNMEGIGNMCDAPKPHPMVRAFYLRDEWGLAEEKLHYLPEAVDVVHNNYGDEPGRPPQEVLEQGRQHLVKGVSPGLAFALEMVRLTRVPQGLIPCAHGGTSMAQWSPSLRGKGGSSLYGAMMRRYEKLGQPIAGLLWYQGESDANREAARVYTPKMIELVSAVRQDMGLPKLPWIMVQLGCHASTEDAVSWNSIQEQQRRLPQAIRHLDVAPAVDLELDDGIHIGGRAQQILGKRLARVADRMVHKSRAALPGIVLEKMEIVPTPFCPSGSGSASLRLAYRNVAGQLESKGLPTGFALLNTHGHDTAGIFKTTVQGNHVLLHTGMQRLQLEKMTVSYGHGRLPYCNITDSDGMSIPVMQAIPVPVDTTRAPECDKWQTALLPGVKTIGELSGTTVARATGWRPAPPRDPFGVLPKLPEENHVAVYAMRATVNCTESLNALFMLAANAPFKLWVNGTMVLTDPAACPPLEPNKYKALVRLRRGKNILLVAFAPPSAGRHLGIFARIGTPGQKVDSRILLEKKTK